MSTPIDSNPQFDSRQIEKLIVHPATAQWLMLNGYTYYYEYSMPEYGRVDFLATHADGHKLLVECKYRTSKKSGRDLMQLVDYRRQMPECRAAFALPKSAASEYVRDICDVYQIVLILLDVDDSIQKAIKTRPRFTAISEDTFNRAMEAIDDHHDCYMYPERRFQDIAERAADLGIMPFYQWLHVCQKNMEFFATYHLIPSSERKLRPIQIRRTWIELMLNYAKTTPELANELLLTIYDHDANFQTDLSLIDVKHDLNTKIAILKVAFDYGDSVGWEVL